MMWPYYQDGWSWLWMGGMMLLFWLGVIALVVWAITAFTGPRSRAEQPQDLLRRRLAAGEISPEDYEKTKKALQG